MRNQDIAPRPANTRAPKFCPHLRAPQSPNGGPQRLYVVYDDNGEVLNVIDEGYRGLPRELRELKRMPDVEISRSTYHEWRRYGAGLEVK